MRSLNPALRQTWPGLLLLLGLVVLCACIYQDYGVSWDENAMRKIGSVNLEYARSGNDSLIAGFSDRDHGAAFELPLVWIESLFPPMEPGTMIGMRHLLSFLFYLGGVWCGYLLALRLFRRQWIALLGMAMLILEPRIFAHAFFNSKDVPFLAAVLIAVYAIHVALTDGRWYHSLLAGIACGYATGIRTMGILVIGLAGVAMLLAAIQDPPIRRSRRLGSILLFGLATLVALYACWPTLWHHPVHYLKESFSNLARYTQWQGSVLLNGVRYEGRELPWYYAPEWFAISTPVVWLLLGLTGAAAGTVAMIRGYRKPLHSAKAKTLSICAGLFFLPLLAVISLHSVLYDDWRHLYFIYPPFVMMALYGVERLWSLQRARVLISLLLVGEIAVAGLDMIRAHPFEQVYFNAFVPDTPEHRRTHFDYEYWGTSYKPALAALLAHCRRDSIPVVWADNSLANNVDVLPPEQRKRIHWISSSEKGVYLMTNFRYHPEDYPYRKIWSIKVGNSTAVQIYMTDTAATPKK